MHLKDFADYCMSDRAPAGWFELLTERNTLFIKEYIKSNWQKKTKFIKSEELNKNMPLLKSQGGYFFVF